MGISCEQCKERVKEFFNKELTPEVYELCLIHMVGCDNCHRFYARYAKEKGYDFDLAKRLIKWSNKRDGLVSPRTPDRIQELKKKTNKKTTGKFTSSCTHDRWTRAAIRYDVAELMQVQAFRDFAIEYDPKYDAGKTDFGEFYKFITKKICQKIDLLERCLDMEVAQNEKSR